MEEWTAAAEEAIRTVAHAKGLEEGREDIVALYNWLKENDRDAEAEAVMKPESGELRLALYKEYDETKKKN